MTSCGTVDDLPRSNNVCQHASVTGDLKSKRILNLKATVSRGSGSRCFFALSSET